jgi:hypothetical protein
MFSPWRAWFLFVAAFAFVVESAPSGSRESLKLNDAELHMSCWNHFLTSDLQERAVCKFKVESQVDYDTKIKYDNVICVNEVFGKCEQLETSLTLPGGRSLNIKSACVYVNKTSSEPAHSKEERPKIV